VVANRDEYIRSKNVFDMVVRPNICEEITFNLGCDNKQTFFITTVKSFKLKKRGGKPF
jgi:hypothetical protein